MFNLETLRTPRISGYAIFDLVLAFGGIYLIAPFLSHVFLFFGLKISRRAWMFLTLPLGVLFHLIFNQSTLLNQDLFSPNGHYFLKILLLGLLILGMREVKFVGRK